MIQKQSQHVDIQSDICAIELYLSGKFLFLIRMYWIRPSIRPFLVKHFVTYTTFNDSYNSENVD